MKMRVLSASLAFFVVFTSPGQIQSPNGPENSLPAILSSPQSQVVAPGGPLALKVTATGVNLRYQWTLNSDWIPGATDSALNFANVTPESGGKFEVIIFSDYGQQKSAPAVVLVSSSALPFNDTFSLAGQIQGTSGGGQGSNLGASSEPGEPNHAGYAPANSIWATWVAPSSGVATIDTIGSAIDTILAVYTGNTVSALTEVASDDDSGGYHASKVMFNAQAGVAYRIVVGSFGRDTGNVALNWTLLPTKYPLPTVTQRPGNLTLLPGAPATLSAGVSGAGFALQWLHNGQPIANANQPNLVIPSSTIGDLGAYQISFSSPDWTYVLPPVEIQFNTEGATNAAALNKLVDAVKSPLANGVASAKPLSSPAPLTGSAGMQPLDSIPAPALLGYSGAQIFQSSPGKDPDEPDACGITGGASYWFCYVPAEDGTLKLNTDGSNYDTLLGVYVDDGSNQGYSSLVQIACDDNSGSNGLTSALQVFVPANSTNYIMLDGVNGAYGTAHLNYQLDRMPSISTFATQTINEEQSTTNIAFTVGDHETAASNLLVFATSSDTNLVPMTNIVFGGSGSNRTVTVTPTPYCYGTNIIAVSVQDSCGNVRSNSFTLNVCKINHAPVANPDSYARLPNKAISIAIAALLRNDTDIDGDTLSLSSVSSKSYYNCNVSRGANFITYTPTPGFNGSDWFTYTITDGNGGYATGTVSISVSPNGQTYVY